MMYWRISKKEKIMDTTAKSSETKLGQISEQLNTMDEKIKRLFEIEANLSDRLSQVSSQNGRPAEDYKAVGGLVPMAETLARFNESLTSLSEALLGAINDLEL